MVCIVVGTVTMVVFVVSRQEPLVSESSVAAPSRPAMLMERPPNKSSITCDRVGSCTLTNFCHSRDAIFPAYELRARPNAFPLQISSFPGEFTIRGVYDKMTDPVWLTASQQQQSASDAVHGTRARWACAAALASDSCGWRWQPPRGGRHCGCTHRRRGRT